MENKTHFYLHIHCTGSASDSRIDELMQRANPETKTKTNLSLGSNKKQDPIKSVDQMFDFMVWDVKLSLNPRCLWGTPTL